MTTKGVDVPSKTDRRIWSLMNLEPGWLYGEGIPPTLTTVQIVLGLLRTATRSGIKHSEVFPGGDGEIMLSLYIDYPSLDHYLDLSVEADHTVTIVLELDNREVRYIEGASVGLAHLTIRSEAQRKAVLESQQKHGDPVARAAGILREIIGDTPEDLRRWNALVEKSFN